MIFIVGHVDYVVVLRIRSQEFDFHVQMSKTCSVSIGLKKSSLFLQTPLNCCSNLPTGFINCNKCQQQVILIRKIWIYFDVLAIFKAILDCLSLKIEFLTSDSQYHFHTGQIKSW